MFLTHLSFRHDHILQIRFVVGGKDHRNIKTQGITRVILDALKSLLSFHLDIDVNAILNYDTNYLLYVNVIRKAIAKAIYLFIYTLFDLQISLQQKPINVNCKNQIRYMCVLI